MASKSTKTVTQSHSHRRRQSVESRTDTSVKGKGKSMLPLPLSTNALFIHDSVLALDFAGQAIGDSGALQVADSLLAPQTKALASTGKKKDGTTTTIPGSSVETQWTTVSLLLSLDLSANGLSTIGVRALCDALKSNHVLERLYLSGNNLGRKGHAEVVDLLTVNRTLRALRLSDTGLEPPAAALLVAALDDSHHPSLAELRVDGNVTGGAVWAELLRGNSSLRVLDLSGVGLETGECGELGEALAASKGQLRALYLQDNAIGNRGFKLLAPALGKHKTLLEVNLNHCGLSGPSLVALAAILAASRTLAILQVADNALGDRGAGSESASGSDSGSSTGEQQMSCSSSSSGGGGSSGGGSSSDCWLSEQQSTKGKGSRKSSKRSRGKSSKGSKGSRGAKGTKGHSSKRAVAASSSSSADAAAAAATQPTTKTKKLKPRPAPDKTPLKDASPISQFAAALQAHTGLRVLNLSRCGFDVIEKHAIRELAVALTVNDKLVNASLLGNGLSADAEARLAGAVSASLSLLVYNDEPIAAWRARAEANDEVVHRSSSRRTSHTAELGGTFGPEPAHSNSNESGSFPTARNGAEHVVDVLPVVPLAVFFGGQGSHGWSHWRLESGLPSAALLRGPLPAGTGGSGGGGGASISAATAKKGSAAAAAAAQGATAAAALEGGPRLRTLHLPQCAFVVDLEYAFPPLLSDPDAPPRASAGSPLTLSLRDATSTLLDLATVLNDPALLRVLIALVYSGPGVDAGALRMAVSRALLLAVTTLELESAVIETLLSLAREAGAVVRFDVLAHAAMLAGTSAAYAMLVHRTLASPLFVLTPPCRAQIPPSPGLLALVQRTRTVALTGENLTRVLGRREHGDLLGRNVLDIAAARNMQAVLERVLSAMPRALCKETFAFMYHDSGPLITPVQEAVLSGAVAALDALLDVPVKRIRWALGYRGGVGLNAHELVAEGRALRLAEATSSAEREQINEDFTRIAAALRTYDGSTGERWPVVVTAMRPAASAALVALSVAHAAGAIVSAPVALTASVLVDGDAIASLSALWDTVLGVPVPRGSELALMPGAAARAAASAAQIGARRPLAADDTRGISDTPEASSAVGKGKSSKGKGKGKGRSGKSSGRGRASSGEGVSDSDSSGVPESRSASSSDDGAGTGTAARLGPPRAAAAAAAASSSSGSSEQAEQSTTAATSHTTTVSRTAGTVASSTSTTAMNSGVSRTVTGGVPKRDSRVSFVIGAIVALALIGVCVFAPLLASRRPPSGATVGFSIAYGLCGLALFAYVIMYALRSPRAWVAPSAPLAPPTWRTVVWTCLTALSLALEFAQLAAVALLGMGDRIHGMGLRDTFRGFILDFDAELYPGLSWGLALALALAWLLVAGYLSASLSVVGSKAEPWRAQSRWRRRLLWLGPRFVDRLPASWLLLPVLCDLAVLPVVRQLTLYHVCESGLRADALASRVIDARPCWTGSYEGRSLVSMLVLLAAVCTLALWLPLVRSAANPSALLRPPPAAALCDLALKVTLGIVSAWSASYRPNIVPVAVVVVALVLLALALAPIHPAAGPAIGAATGWEPYRPRVARVTLLLMAVWVAGVVLVVRNVGSDAAPLHRELKIAFGVGCVDIVLLGLFVAFVDPWQHLRQLARCCCRRSHRRGQARDVESAAYSDRYPTRDSVYSITVRAKANSNTTTATTTEDA